jgi:hypothetical protein
MASTEKVRYYLYRVHEAEAAGILGGLQVGLVQDLFFRLHHKANRGRQRRVIPFNVAAGRINPCANDSSS